MIRPLAIATYYAVGKEDGSDKRLMMIAIRPPLKVNTFGTLRLESLNHLDLWLKMDGWSVPSVPSIVVYVTLPIGYLPCTAKSALPMHH